MRQAVMVSPGVIEFRNVEEPFPDAGQVVIRVMRIGICGSDIHVYHGLHPYTSYPVVQGHEVSGTVWRTGSRVEHLAPGDKVTFMPQVTCGHCYPCRNGMEHICDSLKVMGFQTMGAAQEYFVIDAEKVLRLPPDMSFEDAALIEPISVAVHALRRAHGVSGKGVVVLGAGTIGNLVAQVARATGARDVLLTDISEYKLDKAHRCGLEHTVNTSTSDLSQAILALYGSDKADLIIECVGAQETISQAVLNARKGSQIVVVGVFGKPPSVDMGLVQDRELTVTGTLMYQRPDYERAIALVSGGDLRLGELVTHRFRFEDYPMAYRTIEAAGGNSMKVMISLD
jgi:L-iditol 2-dehydrogenase